MGKAIGNKMRQLLSVQNRNVHQKHIVGNGVFTHLNFISSFLNTLLSRCLNTSTPIYITAPSRLMRLNHLQIPISMYLYEQFAASSPTVRANTNYTTTKRPLAPNSSCSPTRRPTTSALSCTRSGQICTWSLW